MKANFNPMKAKGEPMKIGAGEHTSSKGHSKNKMGAGKQMGPSIAKGFRITGKGKTGPTGGPFKKADKAGSKKGAKGSTS